MQERPEPQRPGEEKSAAAILGGPGGGEEEEEKEEEGGGRAWLRLLEELAAARPGEPALVTNLSHRLGRGRGFGIGWCWAKLMSGRVVMTRTEGSLKRSGGYILGGADIPHLGPAQSLGLQNLTLGSDLQNLLLEHSWGSGPGPGPVLRLAWQIGTSLSQQWRLKWDRHSWSKPPTSVCH